MSLIEIGQTSLINEIFKDNFEACTDVPNVLIKIFLNKIIGSRKIEGNKLKIYLDFFFTII